MRSQIEFAWKIEPLINVSLKRKVQIEEDAAIQWNSLIQPDWYRGRKSIVVEPIFSFLTESRSKTSTWRTSCPVRWLLNETIKLNESFDSIENTYKTNVWFHCGFLQLFFVFVFWLRSLLSKYNRTNGSFSDKVSFFSKFRASTTVISNWAIGQSESHCQERWKNLTSSLRNPKRKETIEQQLVVQG